MKIRYSLFLVVLCFEQFLCGQTIVNISPTCATIEDYPTIPSVASTNYSTLTTSDASDWTSGGQQLWIMSLMQLNLTSIPCGATITSVKLYLYTDGTSENTTIGGSGYLSNACYLNRTTQNWSVSTVTWNNQPTTTTTDQASLANSTSSTENYVVDITQLVIDMIKNPTQGNGLLMSLQNYPNGEYSRIDFYSNNYSVSTSRPLAVVTYTANPLIANAGTSSSICLGSKKSLGGSPTASGGIGQYSYSWSPTSGLSSSIVANPTCTPAATTTYTVTVTDNGGCGTANSSVTLTVNPVPSITAMTGYACSASAFTVTPANSTNGVVPSGTTYTWTTPTVTGSMTGGVANTTASFSITGTLANTTNTTQTATYTVTPVSGSCTGSTFMVTVTVNPTLTLSSTLTPGAICSNTSFSYTPTSGTTGVSFGWSRAAVTGISNTSNSGTGNPGEVLINTTSSPVAVTYVYTLTANGCSNTENVTVTVNPTPTLSSTLTPGAICSNTSFSYTPTSGTTGVSFGWSRAAVTGISNTSNSGTGNPGEVLINTTSSPVAVTYVYTLTANGCSNTENVTVTVNPTPTLSSTLTPGAICSNTSFSYTPTSGTTGVSFGWSRAAVTGISNTSNSGTGNPGEVLINTTSSPVAVTYVYTLTANGCSNTENVTVTVNPTPTLSSTLTPGAICSNTSFSYTPTSGTTGVSFGWSRAAVTGISNTSNSGTGNPGEVLINTTSSPVAVTYVYTLTANGCSNTENVTVTVNPTPTLSSTLTPGAICSNTSFSYTPTSGTTGVSFGWSRAAVTGISNTSNSGTGNPGEVLINTTSSPVAVTYVYTLTANGCSKTENVTVTVNPTLTLSSTLTPGAICSNTSFSYTPTSGTTGVSFGWSRAAVTGISNTSNSGTGNPGEVLINTTSSPVAVTYVYTLTANGCSNTENVTVTVNPTPSITALTLNTCSGSAFSFTPANSPNGVVLSGTTYTWTTPTVTGSMTGGVANTTASSSITGTLTNTTNTTQTATYTVTPESGSCTGSTFTVMVTINPLPVVSISLNPPSGNVCSGSSILMNASGGTSYIWSTGETNATVSETPTKTITYYVTATANGCSGVATQLITINALPDNAGQISGTSNINLGQSEVLYSVPAINNATGYNWTLPPGASINSGNTKDSITVNFSNTAQSGYLTVAGANNCGVGVVSASFPVNIIQPPSAPSNLTGSYNPTSGITITWTDNANDETGFIIERKYDNGTYTQLEMVGSTVTSFICTDLISGRIYTFRVKAYNSSGVSSYSNEYQITLNLNGFDINTQFVQGNFSYSISGNGITTNTYYTGTDNFIAYNGTANTTTVNLQLVNNTTSTVTNLSMNFGIENGISNLQIQKNGNYIALTGDQFQIINEDTLLFNPKGKPLSGTGISLILNQGLYLTPTVPGNYNVLQIIGISNVVNFVINIYNMSGILVFTTNNPSNFWNGIDMNSNSLVPKGVYNYSIQANGNTITGQFIVDYP